MTIRSWLNAVYRRLATRTVPGRPGWRGTNCLAVSAMVETLERRLLLSATIEVEGNDSFATANVVTVPTVDILAALGKVKRANQVLVGFAAETNDLVANALEKVKRKNLDLIVANDVSAPGVGFEHETNAVTILDRLGGSESISLTDKREIARQVIDRAVWFANS